MTVRPPGYTTLAGYGHKDHRIPRAAAFAQLPQYSPCCRCHRTMYKWAKDKHGKSALHYDHNDRRTGYLGFSHSSCNIGARNAAHRGRPIRRGRRRARTTCGVVVDGGAGYGW